MKYLRNMAQKKWRTALTITAVAISMALLLSMLSIGEGIQQSVRNEITDSKRDIIVGVSGSVGLEDGHALARDLLAFDGVGFASPMLVPGAFNLYLPESNATKVALGLGIVPEYEKHLLTSDRVTSITNNLRVRYADWFPTEDDPHHAGNFTGPFTYEMLINKIFAEYHALEKGDEVAIEGPDGNMTVFIVAGFLETEFSEGSAGPFEEVLQNTALVAVHLSELQSVLGLAGDDSISSISLRMEDGRTASDVGDLAKEMRDEYPYLSIITKRDRLAALEEQTVITNLFQMAVSSVAVAIGLLFLACIMIMSVYERTNEIGTMRAIGISSRTIFIDILAESLLIVVIGSFAGLVPGYFGSDYLGRFISSQFGFAVDLTAFTPGIILTSLGLIISAGVLVSLYPAWKACRMKVITALRHVR